MDRAERLDYLLRSLLSERKEFSSIPIPESVNEKTRLLRAIMNVREPMELSDELLCIQDEELSFQVKEKGVVNLDELKYNAIDNRIALWQGDITRLKVDCIVNAANSEMLGCFIPLHNCVDNAIHSAAGMQMRLECNDRIHEIGRSLRPAEYIMTKGYNLPAKYVLHIVGPIIDNGKEPSIEQKELLKMCYTNCLLKSDEEDLESLAFCCISTGVFSFPKKNAAEIAVNAVKQYLFRNPHSSVRRIVFNVFKDEDLYIYKRLLGI